MDSALQGRLGENPMTSEELYGLPEDGNRYELEAGSLLSEPPASFEHGDVVFRIGFLMMRHVRSHDLGRVVGSDVGFVLRRSPDTVRCPDVAFVRKDRLQ